MCRRRVPAIDDEVCVCEDGTWDNNGTCKECNYKCLTCTTENTYIECFHHTRDGEENCVCKDDTYDDDHNAECTEYDENCYACTGALDIVLFVLET